MVGVELAEAGHAAGICRVGTASWRDAYSDVLPDDYVEANIRVRYDPERIAEQIADSDGVGEWLVALDRGAEDGDAIRTVVGTVRDDRPEAGVGEVSGLYVHPDWQGEGVGSRLLSVVTERQRAAGATEQHTYVFADNDAAIGFYESKGFEPDERFAAAAVDDVDPDCEAVRFVRPL
jgi:GNAT superfamily N-acetyltransferase